MSIIDNKTPEVIQYFQNVKELAELLEQETQYMRPVFNGEIFLTNKDLCQLLHISTRTLQEYRDNGILPYIQISGKILYRESDVWKLLMEGYYSVI